MNNHSPIPHYQFPQKADRTVLVTDAYSDVAVILFFLAHIPLALFADINRVISTGYALAMLAFGILWALSKRTPQRFAYLAAYIAGAEVVWRMTNAQVFWEYGKYATALVLLVGILTVPRARSKFIILPILYFLLLVPSTVLTFSNLSFEQARQQVSFNLSGPFSLMICVLFFHGVKFNRAQLANLAIAISAPVTGMSAIIINTIRRAGFSIIFTDASNFATSGGYGPNQVSATLGLAAFFLVIYLLFVKKHLLLKIFFAALLALFTTESILTFSRGGVYIAGASASIVALLSTIGRKSMIRTFFIAASIIAVTYFWLFPFINAFTDGSAVERYRDLSLTGRDTLMQADLEIFQDNPWIGVGPGMAIYNRGGRLNMVAAHTEFTRVLAEHGVMGIFSIFCLLLIGFIRFIKSESRLGRALVAGFWVWVILFLAVNGMRIVAPSLMAGLSAAIFIDEFVQPKPERPSYYGFGKWKKES